MKRIAFLSLIALAVVGCQNSTKKRDADFLAQDSVTGMPLSNRNEGMNFMGGNIDKTMFQPVYFEFDSSNIGSSEYPKLDQVAQFLRNNRASVIIAGFTDETGTTEYNRALGEKRALAVREQLVRKGASAERLQTVSFGEEMLANPNDGTAAVNRRAEFGVAK